MVGDFRIEIDLLMISYFYKDILACLLMFVLIR